LFVERSIVEGCDKEIVVIIYVRLRILKWSSGKIRGAGDNPVQDVTPALHSEGLSDLVHR
jgi:hypothetical protein